MRFPNTRNYWCLNGRCYWNGYGAHEIKISCLNVVQQLLKVVKTLDKSYFVDSTKYGKKSHNVYQMLIKKIFEQPIKILW